MNGKMDFPEVISEYAEAVWRRATSLFDHGLFPSRTPSAVRSQASKSLTLCMFHQPSI